MPTTLIMLNNRSVVQTSKTARRPVLKAANHFLLEVERMAV